MLKLGRVGQMFEGVASAGSRLSPIGVDFGVSSLKLLQLHLGEPPSLVAAASVEVPASLRSDLAKRLEFQFAELPRLIRKGGFRGKRAVATIPAEQTLCKALQTSRIQGVSLAEVVSHALAEQLECHPDALVCRPIEVGSGTRSGKTEVLGIAAPRELVQRLMGALRQARLDPVGMHSEVAAAVAAFEDLHRKPEDQNKTTLYVDIGAGTTKVVIATGRSPTFARLVDVGGRFIEREIERQLDCRPEQAARAWLELESIDDALPRTMKRAAGAESISVAPAAGGRLAASSTTAGFDLSEPLEILTDEVSMAVRYHESVFPQRRLERIVFVGGEARQVALCQHIARSVRLTAQIADPMARVARSGKEPCKGVDFAQPQPGWAVAMGLCLSPTDL